MEQPQRSAALQQLVDQLDAAEASGVLAEVRETLAQANDLLVKLQESAAGYMPTESEAGLEKRGRGRPKKWLQVADVAEELERNEQTIRRWMRSGKMPAHKIHNEYKIRRQDFDEWLEEQRVKVPD